jgi:hypothetical protein
VHANTHPLFPRKSSSMERPWFFPRKEPNCTPRSPISTLSSSFSSSRRSPLYGLSGPWPAVGERTQKGHVRADQSGATRRAESAAIFLHIRPFFVVCRRNFWTSVSRSFIIPNPILLHKWNFNKILNTNPVSLIVRLLRQQGAFHSSESQRAVE